MGYLSIWGGSVFAGVTLLGVFWGGSSVIISMF